MKMHTFSKANLGVSPDINAQAALIIAAVSLDVLIAWVAMMRNERDQRDRMLYTPQAFIDHAHLWGARR